MKHTPIRPATTHGAAMRSGVGADAPARALTSSRGPRAGQLSPTTRATIARLALAVLAQVALPRRQSMIPVPVLVTPPETDAARRIYVQAMISHVDARLNDQGGSSGYRARLLTLELVTAGVARLSDDTDGDGWPVLTMFGITGTATSDGGPAILRNWQSAARDWLARP